MSLPFLSRLMVNLLDTRRRGDYAVAFVIGTLPVVYSFLIGVAFSQGEGCSRYAGYLRSVNFSSFSILIPLGLYAMRRVAAKVVPVVGESMPAVPPGVIELFEPPGRVHAYGELRRSIIAPGVIGAALLVDLAINVIDSAPFVLVYSKALLHVASGVPQAYRDWSMLSLIPRQAGLAALAAPWAGIPMAVLAYLAQFVIILFPFLFFFAAFRHNMFFLRSIYQRSRPEADPENRIVIKLDDSEKCFGFRTANRSFNAQVGALVFCGCFMLVSRFAVVGRLMSDPCSSHSLSVLAPNAGQVMLGLGWLGALAVVSMPALVKLLPLISELRGKAPEQATAVRYLREFLPTGLKADPSSEEVDYIASKFATNAFWPTGNNRASQLFFFSFGVFLVMLVPVVLPGWPPWILAYVAAILLGASALTKGAFFLLSRALVHIDERLAIAPATPVPEPESLKAARRNDIVMDLLIELSGAESPFTVSFEWTVPGGNTARTAKGTAGFQVARLRAILSAEEHGRELGAALFASTTLRDAWVAVNAAAESCSALRVRMLIAPEAVNLNTLRWETLRDPNGVEAFRGGRRWFSRFLTSDSDKPPAKRDLDQLKALAVIASPKQLELRRGGLEPIPVAEEEARVRKFFEGICASEPVILNSGGKATFAAILQKLQDEPDIVYIICHGSTRDGVPRLLLEKEDGSLDYTEAGALIQAVRDLAVPPGLIVLASCQSAGSGETEDAIVALGPQLSASGVPAVVAMQGKVDILTVAAFMPLFFGELRQHGRADEAMAVARGQIARRFSDYWMPVLFMQSKNGALWGGG